MQYMTQSGKMDYYINCDILSPVKIFNNMLSDRSFQIIMGDNISKVRRLNNGLPQSFVMAPILFNLYMSDMPVKRGCKFGNADDLSIVVQEKLMKVVDNLLSKDLKILRKFFTD